MTIRNRLHIIALSCAILLIVALLGQTLIKNKHSELEWAENHLHMSRDTLITLNILTSDYLQTRGKRAYRQWQVTEAEMAKMINDLDRLPNIFDTERRKSLQEKFAELRQLFYRLAAMRAPGMNTNNLSPPEASQLDKVLSSQLLLTAREMLAIINTVDIEQHSILSAMYKKMDRLANLFLLLMLAMVLGILFWFSKTIRPLKLLQRSAMAVAHGDYDVQLEINTRDELAEVANSFIAMRDVVREKIEHLQTEMKARQEAEKQLVEKQAQLAHAGRLNALGEMATGIAHEINQPLTIVNLANEVLKEYFSKHNDASLENDAVRSVEEQVKRATSIITNMRTFARAKANHVDLIDITEPLHIALSFFREQFRLHEIELHTSIAESLPPVEMDPQKFEQIVVNLLSNARYAVEKRAEYANKDYRKTITIKLAADFDRKIVTFEIHDNGIGMSAETCDRCLEPFFTNKEVGEGTGLGLSIVQTIITEFKGRIDVESTQGEGTLFQIFFPIRGEK